MSLCLFLYVASLFYLYKIQFTILAVNCNLIIKCEPFIPKLVNTILIILALTEAIKGQTINFCGQNSFQFTAFIPQTLSLST